MSLLDIYCEHDALLTRKGYDEASLNSPYRKGWMGRELLQYLGRAVVQMFDDPSPTDFTLKTVAFFNEKDNDTDIVQYQFNYRFDPEAETLRIYRLDVLWDDKIKKIDLKKNEDLPDAKQAFQMVKDYNQVIEQRNKRIKIIQVKGNRRHL